MFHNKFINFCPLFFDLIMK